MQEVTQYLLGVRNHGAELKAAEGSAMATGSRVTVNDWTAVAHQRQTNHEQQRGEHQSQRQCANNIEQALGRLTRLAQYQVPLGSQRGMRFVVMGCMVHQGNRRGGFQGACGSCAVSERGVNLSWAELVRRVLSVVLPQAQ